MLEIESHNSYVKLNGRRFHYIWLRDNCLSNQNRHPTSFQKIYDFSDNKEFPNPKSVKLGDEKLIIEWNEEPPHRSVFPVEWLMAFAYDQEFLDGSVSKPIEAGARYNEEILWNKDFIENNFPECEKSSLENSRLWKDQLFRFGFSLIHGLNSQENKDFISSIGPLLHTEAGAFYEVKFKPGANDLGDTLHALTPHTDFPNRDYPHLLTCFYMAENESLGGESILIDGFQVADDLRKKYPDYFQLLSEIPVQFRQFYTDWKFFYTQSAPIIKLDSSENVVAINFAHSHASNWNIPFAHVEDFYKAYAKFFNYLKDPYYQVSFRLNKGDCLLMNNNRILHGRKPFDITLGVRVLRIGYVVWDHITGRENFDKLKDLYL